MTLLEHLDRMAAYGTWADGHLLATLQAAADAPVPARCTNLFAHIQAARLLWFARIEGGDVASVELFPEANLADCVRLREQAEAAWMRLRNTIDDAALAREIHYAGLDGSKHHSPLRDALTQLADHATYHRAQIVSAMHEAGLELPKPAATFIVYARMIEGRA